MSPEARTRRVLAELEPALAAAVAKVLAGMAASGHPMVAYDGRRTGEEQAALYAAGRTAPGRIVTYADGIKVRSAHQDGRAVDCAFVLRRDGPQGWALTWSGPWAAYGALGEAEGLVWGGRWKLRDHPHLALRTE